VKTPYVTSSEALRTEEFSLLESGVLDNKFYVPTSASCVSRPSREATTF